jgi:hypothetical protein
VRRGIDLHVQATMQHALPCCPVLPSAPQSSRFFPFLYLTIEAISS